MPSAVTGNVIYNHFSYPCSYRVHLDLNGDRSLRAAPSATGRYLMDRGIRHEARVFERIRTEAPDDWADAGGDPNAADREAEFRARAERTQELMRRGVRWIFHGFLHSHEGEFKRFRPGAGWEDSDLVFRGETDILHRVEEPSPELGAWSYVVGDVKSSRHARFGQKMQVAFYSWILERRQGVLPGTGFIVTGGGEREDFAIDEVFPSLRLFVEEELHDYRDPERVFYHLQPACSSCHWRDVCRERAAREDDLSLVPGCRRSEKRTLIAAGIRSRADLLKQEDKLLRGLGKTTGRRLDGFRDLKQVASAQSFGQPVVRQHPAAATPAAGAGGSASPSLFHHRGPLLLIASVPDHYFGDEVMIGARMIRKPDLLAGRGAQEPVVFFGSREPERPERTLGRLFEHLDEANTLLRASRTFALAVFVDGRVPFRLRRQAESLDSPTVRARLESLLADSVILTDVVDRTYFLPTTTSGIHDIATVLTSRPGPPHQRTPVADHASAGVLTAIANDYELDRDALRHEGNDIRFLMVREWRESGQEAWDELIRFELEEELRAGATVLERLFRI